MKPFIIVLIIILGIVLVIVSLNLFQTHKLTKEDIGKIGERKVKKVLGKPMQNKKYVFNNYFLYENEKSVQIDHILITRTGVFVIETKNLSGHIFGNDSQFNWIQTLHYGSIKNPFYSPVKQNFSHVYELKKILPNDIPIYSVVVFVSANIDNVSSDYVYNLHELKYIVKSKQKNLTKAQLNSIAKTINEHNATGKTTLEQHIEQTKELQYKINVENICPRCGGNIVTKHGPFGDFLSCENYPKCKFVKKANNIK